MVLWYNKKCLINISFYKDDIFSDQETFHTHWKTEYLDR